MTTPTPSQHLEPAPDADPMKKRVIELLDAKDYDTLLDLIRDGQVQSEHIPNFDPFKAARLLYIPILVQKPTLILREVAPDGVRFYHLKRWAADDGLIAQLVLRLLDDNTLDPESFDFITEDEVFINDRQIVYQAPQNAAPDSQGA